MMFSPLFTPKISARFLYKLNLRLLPAETRTAKMSHKFTNLARYEIDIPDRMGVV